MPDNSERCKRAKMTLERYKNLVYGVRQAPYEPNDQAVTDLLSDLLHYCADEKIDFNRAYFMAQLHVEAELED